MQGFFLKDIIYTNQKIIFILHLTKNYHFALNKIKYFRLTKLFNLSTPDFSINNVTSILIFVFTDSFPAYWVHIPFPRYNSHFPLDCIQIIEQQDHFCVPCNLDLFISKAKYKSSWRECAPVFKTPWRPFIHGSLYVYVF